MHTHHPGKCPTARPYDAPIAMPETVAPVDAGLTNSNTSRACSRGTATTCCYWIRAQTPMRRSSACARDSSSCARVSDVSSRSTC
jgi:hypothetical protein